MFNGKYVLAALWVCAVVAAPAWAQKKTEAGRAAEGGPAAVAAAETSRTFVTVNGVAIPEIQARILMAERLAAGAKDTPELRAAVRDQLVLRELQVQQAKSQKLDKNPAVVERMRMADDELLALAYRQSFVTKHPVSDQDVSREYEDIKARAGNREFHLRHILLDSEDAAKGAIARLKQNEKFEDVAKQSKDVASGRRGGDLGWLTPVNLLPSIVEAVTGFGKAGLLPAPVRTPAGWHVVQIDEIRPFTMPALNDTLRQQISADLGRRALDNQLAQLLKGARIQ